MPINKFDKGRTAVSGSSGDPCVFNYVMREGLYSPENVEEHKKPLGLTLINLEEKDSQGRTWGEQMDHTREQKYAETNYWSKTPRTYMSFKLSPDPKDDISLEEFDDFCREFADRAFEQKFQIAIVYHDDNENNILHAHFIVNSPILGETSKVNYLSNWLDSKARLRFIMDLPDYMARERGWSNFIDDAIEKEKSFEAAKRNIYDKDEHYVNKKTIEDDIDTKYKNNEDYYKSNYYFNQEKFTFEKKTPRYSYKSAFDNFAEREIQKKGKVSWKKDIKDRIDCVRHLAITEKEYYSMLSTVGIDCKLTKNNEYQYRVKGSEYLVVNGPTLGKDFTKQSILNCLSKNLSATRKSRLKSVEEKDGVVEFNHYKINVTRKGARYGKKEREIIQKTGWSQNEDIRQRVEYALKISKTESEFIQNLLNFGVNVEITDSGDYKYSHPDPESNLRVTGERLGGINGLYSRNTISEQLGFNKYKDNDLFKYLTTKKLSKFEIFINNRFAIAKSLEGYGLVGISVVRNPNNISLKQYAKACQIRADFAIFSNKDFDTLIEKNPNNTDLIEARNVLFAVCDTADNLIMDVKLDTLETKLSAIDTSGFDKKRDDRIKEIDKKRKKKLQRNLSNYDLPKEEAHRGSRDFKR